LDLLTTLGGAASEIGLLENSFAAVSIGLDLIIIDIVDASTLYRFVCV